MITFDAKLYFQVVEVLAGWGRAQTGDELISLRE